MGDLATIGVAIVGLAGGYVGGQQKAKGDLGVAREETARLREEIEAKRFEHRMGVYHNILALAAKIEHSARVPNSVYRGGDGWAINEKFKEEVDGLTVFGALEPRRHALAMRAALDGAAHDEDVSWIDRFTASKQAFMEAAHGDVGPDTNREGAAS